MDCAARLTTNHKGSCLLAPALVLLLFFTASRAEPRVAAKVDRTRLGLDEQLLLTITVSGIVDSCVPEPYLPALRDFHRSKWTKFASSRSDADTSVRELCVVYGRILRPRYTGRLTIGSATLKCDGITCQTPVLRVLVVDSATAAAAAPPGRNGPPLRTRAGNHANRVLLLRSLDRDTVYVGEQVTVSYQVGYQDRLAGLVIDSDPEYRGCWVHPLKEISQATFQPAQDSGWHWTTLSQAALFPFTSGLLLLGGMCISGTVAEPNALLNGTFSPFTASVGPTRTMVRPLPDSGRPADFSGGVGSFTLDSRLSSSISENGQHLLLTVTVTGTGNIGLVGSPAVAAPAGMTLLAPTESSETWLSGKAVAGLRSFCYRVVPRTDGRHIVPGISMSFFSPAQKSYYTLSTPPLAFEACGTISDTRPPMIATALCAKADIVHIKPDHVMLGNPPGPGGWHASPPWWGWLFYPVGVMLLATGLAVKRLRQLLEHEPGYARRLGATPRLRKRLAEAKRALSMSDMPGFYGSLSRALLGFVGDRFNLETGGMTLEALSQELGNRHAAPAAVTDLVDILAECDAGRFSPHKKPDCADALLERAVRAMRSL